MQLLTDAADQDDKAEKELCKTSRNQPPDD
jgi:hypothetical protein